MQQSEYVSVTGAARMLNKSENTIRLWERQGKIAALKTETGKRFFPRIEVERVANTLIQKTA
jgi:predicted site-specific integrase-resolvase